MNASTDKPNRPVVPHDKTWVTRSLRNLRKSFEEVGGEPQDQMAFGLILADVCDALKLSRVQRFSVLGWQGESFLSDWGDTPVNLTVDDGEKEERVSGS